jgi:hypothetical protein
MNAFTHNIIMLFNYKHHKSHRRATDSYLISVYLCNLKHLKRQIQTTMTPSLQTSVAPRSLAIGQPEDNNFIDEIRSRL